MLPDLIWKESSGILPLFADSVLRVYGFYPRDFSKESDNFQFLHECFFDFVAVLC